MRVALVQERIDAWRGGAETSTLEMARALVALGLDVTIVCANTGEPDRAATAAAPAKVYAVPVGSGSRTQQTIRFVSEADRYCRMEGFEIVHAITPCLSANVYQPRGGTYKETIKQGIASGRSWIGRLSKWFSRRTNRRQRFLALLEQSILTDARPPFVAALSQYVRRQVRDGYGVPDERIHVIFNGVDLTPLASAEAAAARGRVREALHIAADARVALFAAHNFALKGLRELIEAAATPIGRDAGFIVVVAGRDRAAPYERLARRRGVGERFVFSGPADDMRVMYASADALAHPTWYDPCSRVALEALICGLPVVTTRFNGAADVMEDGLHGVVIETPDQPQVLAEALVAALGDTLRQECKSSATNTREHLSMARHVRELQALYEIAARQWPCD